MKVQEWQNEKRFLSVFLAAAIILCSLFSAQSVSVVSAEEYDTDITVTDAISEPDEKTPETTLPKLTGINQQKWNVNPNVVVVTAISGTSTANTTNQTTTTTTSKVSLSAASESTQYLKAVVGEVTADLNMYTENDKIIIPIELEENKSSVDITIEYNGPNCGMLCPYCILDENGDYISRTYIGESEKSVITFTLTGTKAYVWYNVCDGLVPEDIEFKYSAMGESYIENDVLITPVYEFEGGRLTLVRNSEVTTAVTSSVANVTATSQTTVTKASVSVFTVTSLIELTMPGSVSVAVIQKNGTAGNVTVKAGETIDIPVELESNQESARIYVDFPDEAEFMWAFDENEQALGVQYPCYSNDPSSVSFSITGTKAFITLKASEDMPAGEYKINIKANARGDYVKVAENAYISYSYEYNISGGEFVVTENASVYETYPVISTMISTTCSASSPMCGGLTAKSTTVYKEAAVGNVTAKCGEKVIVPLELDSVNTNATVVISLPEGITCEKIVDDSGSVIEMTGSSDVKFNMSSTKAYITYSVDESLPDGEYSINYEIYEYYYLTVIGDSYGYANAVYNVSGGDFSVTGNSVAATSTAATYTKTTDTQITTTTDENELPIVPAEPVKGDANEDGKLLANDAAFIARKLAEAALSGKKITVEDYPYADFNDDGKITAYDAALIAKYIAEQALNRIEEKVLYNYSSLENVTTTSSVTSAENEAFSTVLTDISVSGTEPVTVTSATSFSLTMITSASMITSPTMSTCFAEPGGYIKIENQPDKVNYDIGEELDLTGLTVSLVFYPGGATTDPQYHYNAYDNVSPFDYPDIFVVDTSSFDSTKNGEYSIRICCTDKAARRYWAFGTTKFNVTVGDGAATSSETTNTETTETTVTTTVSSTAATSFSLTMITSVSMITSTTMSTCLAERGGYIKIENQPDKVNYDIGEELDLTELTVSLVFYPGGATTDPQYHYNVCYNVSPFDYPDIFVVDTSSFDSTQNGEYSIRICCTDEVAWRYWAFGTRKFNVTVGDGAATSTETTNTETTETTVTTTVSSTASSATDENELPVIPVEPVKGDANEDGKLLANDAAFIARKLAEAALSGKKITVEDYPYADFNDDGKITAYDAALIAKYIAEQALNK